MSYNRVISTPGRKTSPGNHAKDPIEVFCRIRPLADKEESCVEILNDKVLQITAPKNQKSILSRVEHVKCTFDKIFKQVVTQKQMFEDVGLPLVRDLLLGKNGLCFMYGITGSGKTFTMNGEPSDGGLLPRCLDCIFNSIKHLQTPRCVIKPDGYNGFIIVSADDAKDEAATKYSDMQLLKEKDIYDTGRLSDTTTLEVEEDNNYAIFVTFVEIYNNSVFDLLENVAFDTFKQPKPSGSKILREDRKGNIFVYEVSEVEVKNTAEAFTLFRMGQHKRKTAHTLLNTESSRSHCVFTIKLVQTPLGPTGHMIMKDSSMIGISQLSLCDLAGSERISRTKTEGEKVRQAGHINNSLMTLRSCIEVLRANQKNVDGVSRMVVPYRDSKLTHLFRNYFDGEGRLRMVVCLNPRSDNFDESLHVMRFAEMTQEVKVARSEGVKFDLGLTPGKSNTRFKAMKSVSDGTTNQEDILLPLQQFSPWPLVAGFNDYTLHSLMQYLEERIKLRQTLYGDCKHKQVEIRGMILQLEQDNVDLTQAMEEQRVLLSDKESESKSYEKRIRTLNEKYETLQRSSHASEAEQRQLSMDLEKHKELVNQERQKKFKLKQTLKELTSNERLRWEKECERRVCHKQLEMEGKVLVKNEKLRQLRDVVQDLQLPEENQIRLNRIILGEKIIQNTNKAPNQHRQYNNNVNRYESHKHNQNEKYDPSERNHKTPSHVKKSKKLPSNQPKPRLHTKSNVRSKSPPASALSRKYDVAPIRGTHRRSKSYDFWLNHKPADTVSTNTLMQPFIRNKKTVKTPNVKELKVIPNYILTHQEEDSAGEIETKLIKGEVHGTRGGGSSVQFTVVETLKTNIPGMASQKISSHKQKSEKSSWHPNTPKTSKNPNKDAIKSNTKKRKSIDNDIQSDWTDVETRCCVGIEGKTGCVPGIVHHNKKLKS